MSASTHSGGLEGDGLSSSHCYLFFIQIWDIGSVAWCMMGVMLLYGSQPVTDGGEKARCTVIGCYVSSRTEWSLLPFEHDRF